VLAPADAASGATPTTLLESTDKGSTWREVAKTDDAMLGFGLAPDGAKLAYGSIGHGIFVGPSDGSAPLVKVSEVQNRCLTWSSAGLYACGTDLGRGAPATAPFTQPADTFAVGLSHDMGTSYDTLYRLFQTCPTTCPDDSRYNRTCRTTWELKPGVTTATGATGETCTVPWAKTEVPDAGNGSGSGGAGGAAGGAGGGGGGGDRDAGSGGSAGPDTPTGDSCACRSAGAQDRRPLAGAWGIGLAAVAWFARSRALRRRSATVRFR
jgi:hypothetical protein